MYIVSNSLGDGVVVVWAKLLLGLPAYHIWVPGLTCGATLSPGPAVCQCICEAVDDNIFVGWSSWSQALAEASCNCCGCLELVGGRSLSLCVLSLPLFATLPFKHIHFENSLYYFLQLNPVCVVSFSGCRDINNSEWVHFLCILHGTVGKIPKVFWGRTWIFTAIGHEVVEFKI